MLGVVVGQVGFAGTPEETELLLCFVASEPVDPYIHCFCLSRLNVAVDGPYCGGAVCLHRSGGLRVAHFDE